MSHLSRQLREAIRTGKWPGDDAVTALMQTVVLSPVPPSELKEAADVIFSRIAEEEIVKMACRYELVIDRTLLGRGISSPGTDADLRGREPVWKMVQRWAASRVRRDAETGCVLLIREGVIRRFTRKTISTEYLEELERKRKEREAALVYLTGLKRGWPPVEGKMIAVELPLDAHREAGPEAELIRRDLLGRVQRCMARLSPQEVTVLVQRECDGLQWRAIAEGLRVSVRTAQNRYNSGLTKLTRLLSQELGT
jgi:DNA-directed RNA polymerase specialized sigma24 family protein